MNLEQNHIKYDTITMLLRRAAELLIVVGVALFAQVFFGMTTGRPLDLLATSDLGWCCAWHACLLNILPSHAQEVQIKILSISLQADGCYLLLEPCKEFGFWSYSDLEDLLGYGFHRSLLWNQEQ